VSEENRYAAPVVPQLRLLAYGKYVDGVFYVPENAYITALLDVPRHGYSEILLYATGDCTGAPKFRGVDAMTVSSGNGKLGASFQGMFGGFLDNTTTVYRDYPGPCVPVRWDSDVYYGNGVPATPIGGDGEPILIEDGSTPARDEPVVSLPNTGSGENDGPPLVWLGIGAAILVSGFALRWRGARPRS
jgi:hypothetical protein